MLDSMNKPFNATLLCLSALALVACAGGPGRAEERWERIMASSQSAPAPASLGTEAAAPLGDGSVVPPADASAFLAGRDDAAAIQAAIDSGAPIVLVPDLGRPWLLERGIKLKSGLTLIFEPGCRIEAAPGAFLGKGDCLFEGDGVSDLSILGHGASWSMRKEEYRAAPYEPSQWRHALSLRAAKRVEVRGLRISSSGGDGVYLGSLPLEGEELREACSDIVLAELRLEDHHRQGVSVTAAERLLIERCVVTGTRGHLPSAGIDFEPNARDRGFREVVVRDCYIADNAGPALLVALGRLKENAWAVDILIEGGELLGAPIAFSLYQASRQSGEVRLDGVRLNGLVLRGDGTGVRAVGP